VAAKKQVTEPKFESVFWALWYELCLAATLALKTRRSLTLKASKSKNSK
jgi:hypothetical protein